MKGPKNILVAVAWPYANGEQHIGHISGVYLPADIFARFQRMQGNTVAMVSGSDAHGTPITVSADKEGLPPLEVVKKYHQKFVDSYLKFGVTFDLFTSTHTENHEQVSQKMFLKHNEHGYLYKETQKQLFDPIVNKFLPDRYVEGTCPFCASPEARGDQCDNCGKTYDAAELKNPKSKLSGSTELSLRETEHFFIDLAKLNEPLLKWMKEGKDHWRTPVINYALGILEQKKLRGRPITRDLEWGIPVPLPGFAGKCMYVWYEAVLGYLSASVEWAKLQGKPDRWLDFWNPKATNARTYYFLGKDNTDFHSILWPAMLIANRDLALPYDVVASEYLNMYGRKLSKSRGHMIKIGDVLETYQVDAWRFALTSLAPETVDSDFTWDDFLERVNNELVANWGNLVNRVLGLTYKRFNGKVPDGGTLSTDDEEVLKEIRGGFESVAVHYDAAKSKAALHELLRLSQRVNQYLSDRAPWKSTDMEEVARILRVALQAITYLKTLWSPVLPHSCQQLHEQLGFTGQLFGRQYTEAVNDKFGEHIVLKYDHSTATETWTPKELPIGQQLLEPKALFQKLDPKVVLPEPTSAEATTGKANL